MLPGEINITPSATLVSVGPVNIDFYGLGYAVALGVGVLLAGRQARKRGEDPEHIANAIIFVFVVGLIGARLYHVIDQWNNIYAHDPIKVILPPYTGLGIYGGIAGGIVATFVYTRRHQLSFLRWADIAVPSILIGQAIARWGNFFNQELYGPPTNLPWGIAIDCQHRVAAYPCSTYPFATTGFHPLFFYESALDLLGGLVALWAVARLSGWLRDGDLFSFWFIWYGAVRSILEPLRDTYNWQFFGVPMAMIIGGAVIVFGIATIVIRHRLPGVSVADSPGPLLRGDDDAAAGGSGERAEQDVTAPSTS